jgi:hypothetical protein
MLAMLERYAHQAITGCILCPASIQDLQLRDASEIKLLQVNSVPVLRDFAPAMLAERFRALKGSYLRKHGQPPDFATLLQRLIEKARQMADKSRKSKVSPQKTTSDNVASTTTAGKLNQQYKSAEFVSTSDEEEDEDS